MDGSRIWILNCTTILEILIEMSPLSIPEGGSDTASSLDGLRTKAMWACFALMKSDLIGCSLSVGLGFFILEKLAIAAAAEVLDDKEEEDLEQKKNHVLFRSCNVPLM